jgi:hypothetical protein
MKKGIEELGKLDAPEGPGQSVPAQPLDYGDPGMTFQEMMEGLKQAQQTSFQGYKPEAKTKSKTVTTPVKKRVMRSAPVKSAPAPAIVEPKEEHGVSGMEVYSDGVEDVRGKFGDEAAKLARKDMAAADWERAEKEYGGATAQDHEAAGLDVLTAPDGWESTFTQDGQQWFLSPETGEVFRATGLQQQDVDADPTFTSSSKVTG